MPRATKCESSDGVQSARPCGRARRKAASTRHHPMTPTPKGAGGPPMSALTWTPNGVRVSTSSRWLPTGSTLSAARLTPVSSFEVRTSATTDGGSSTCFRPIHGTHTTRGAARVCTRAAQKCRLPARSAGECCRVPKSSVMTASPGLCVSVRHLMPTARSFSAIAPSTTIRRRSARRAGSRTVVDS